MNTLIMILHVFTCVVLVIVVLLQSGKEGGLGFAGGGGSSQTVFGSSGGANFFTKFTSGAAVVFMLTSIALTVMKAGKRTSVFENAATTQSAPSAMPATTPAKQ